MKMKAVQQSKRCCLTPATGQMALPAERESNGDWRQSGISRMDTSAIWV